VRDTGPQQGRSRAIWAIRRARSPRGVSPVSPWPGCWKRRSNACGNRLIQRAFRAHSPRLRRIDPTISSAQRPRRRSAPPPLIDSTHGTSGEVRITVYPWAAPLRSRPSLFTRDCVTLLQGCSRRMGCGDRSGPVGALDVTHQTWTGTTRTATKTGVFNGYRKFGE
jgi:hypothetical protein